MSTLDSVFQEKDYKEGVCSMKALGRKKGREKMNKHIIYTS